jgi:hypothetical protein
MKECKNWDETANSVQNINKSCITKNLRVRRTKIDFFKVPHAYIYNSEINYATSHEITYSK